MSRLEYIISKRIDTIMDKMCMMYVIVAHFGVLYIGIHLLIYLWRNWS